MAQVLIVEGKDGYAVSNLLLKRKVNPPKGYKRLMNDKDRKRFINNFFKNAEGLSKIEIAIKEALDNSQMTNIGIIVDADEKEPQARFLELIQIIKTAKNIEFPDDLDLGEDGFSIEVEDNLKIGIWVMPDNDSTGYLEHFLTELIPTGNQILAFANQKVTEFAEEDFCSLTEIRKPKAILYTFLALQKKPGLPPGWAIQANFIGNDSPAARHFENWYKNTFQLDE